MISKECKILYIYIVICCGGFYFSCWIIDGMLLVVWQLVSMYFVVECCIFFSLLGVGLGRGFYIE